MTTKTARKTSTTTTKVTLPKGFDAAENKKAQKVITDLGDTTWSAKIRALDGASFTRSQIANFLGKRYQHVRNVLEQPLKAVGA